ncbi:DNA-directed RNA polymerase subunit P [Candidatus Woesearchaeota archaeon]|nr:MAG: DNA-directed RNA polymerase subunit P [Candidatus Woesearchaeota archaeon]
MVKYTCFLCSKKISEDMIGRRVRCPYCGSKILYKSRSKSTKVLAV